MWLTIFAVPQFSDRPLLAAPGLAAWLPSASASSPVSWQLLSTCCWLPLLLALPCDMVAFLTILSFFKLLHRPASGALVLLKKNSCFGARFGANRCSLTLVFLMLDSSAKHRLFLRLSRWHNVFKRSICFSVHSPVSCSHRVAFTGADRWHAHAYNP